MLIPSSRHRPEDLALWAELEEADRIHGERLLGSGKVERSLGAIRDFTAVGPSYCAISWGKDSVVLAHLWWQLFGPKGPWSVWHARPERMPETELVETAFLSALPLRYARLMFASSSAVADYERLTGTRRYVSGVRADESGVRKISARVHGTATENCCRPLLWWTAADVFGYLALYSLPVHPIYAMLGNGRWQRDHLRVEVLGGTEGDQFGRREHELEYYGDVLRRLRA